MTWTTVLARWPHLLDHLCRDFAQLEIAALQRFRGDRAKMELYLAETHELTVDEARDVLDDWLTYRATRIAVPAAA